MLRANNCSPHHLKQKGRSLSSRSIQFSGIPFAVFIDQRHRLLLLPYNKPRALKHLLRPAGQYALSFESLRGKGSAEEGTRMRAHKRLPKQEFAPLPRTWLACAGLFQQASKTLSS